MTDIEKKAEEIAQRISDDGLEYNIAVRAAKLALESCQKEIIYAEADALETIRKVKDVLRNQALEDAAKEAEKCKCSDLLYDAETWNPAVERIMANIRSLKSRGSNEH